MNRNDPPRRPRLQPLDALLVRADQDDVAGGQDVSGRAQFPAAGANSAAAAKGAGRGADSADLSV